jgi:acetolactate synthase regulatory subunit
VSLYELVAPGTLTAPVLVVAFDGWVNAGDAGTTAAETLAAEGEEIVRFDADALFDFRDTRPTIDFRQGVMEAIGWPQVTIRRRTVDGRDLLVLSGTEPSLGWHRLGNAVVELAGRLRVTEHISLGGIPWAAPHTRPVTIITTGSSPDRIPPSDDHPEGLLRVPASAVSAVELAVARTGIPTIGFWARVPNYLGTAFHAAALALVARVGRHLEIELPTLELATEAAEQLIQIDAVVAGRPDVRTLVEQLENLVDGRPPVTGEQIAAEIERFLRSGGEGGPLGE